MVDHLIRYGVSVVVCLLLSVGAGLANESKALLRPERVVLNITQTPSISQAVTWRTREMPVRPTAQVVRVVDLFNPDASPRTLTAETSAQKISENTVVYHHSVVFDDLMPGVLYAYRVGNDAWFSEWNQFKTASDTSAPFTFLYFGDIQKQIFPMCSQILRAAFQKTPETGFWLFAGDMVNNGPDDEEWEEFFSAMGWISRTISLVPVPGNHEYPDPRGILPWKRHITDLWQAHFTLPENGPGGLEETAFTFNYQNACFIILNGNEKLAEQAAWLETLLTQNTHRWIIVCIHQSVYSISDRRDSKEFQTLLVPLFDRFSVDLVLSGHDHGYARSFSLKNGRKTSIFQKGTVYVISNAGPKYYKLSDRYEPLMARSLAREMMFQSIRVEKNALTYTAYNLSKEKVDSFVLRK